MVLYGVIVSDMWYTFVIKVFIFYRRGPRRTSEEMRGFAGMNADLLGFGTVLGLAGLFWVLLNSGSLL